MVGRAALGLLVNASLCSSHVSAPGTQLHEVCRCVNSVCAPTGRQIACTGSLRMFSDGQVCCPTVDVEYHEPPSTHGCAFGFSCIFDF